MHCIDCPTDQPEEDKILGTVSSMRCLYHAIQARSLYGRHTEGCELTFYEPEPITLDLDDWTRDTVNSILAVTLAALLIVVSGGLLVHWGLLPSH